MSKVGDGIVRRVPWLIVALDELADGVLEVPGPGSNPRILDYLATVGLSNVGDETPWCAGFVQWCLQQAGRPGTGRAAARSYLRWGRQTTADVGAVAVLWRGSPKGWQGHVGFVLDKDAATVTLLGGNQGDRVSVARYPVERVLDYRIPAGPATGDE